MLAEFFWAPSWRTTAIAWAGFLVVVGYAYFLASVKARLNDFYSSFYDLLQKGGDVDVTPGFMKKQAAPSKPKPAVAGGDGPTQRQLAMQALQLCCHTC